MGFILKPFHGFFFDRVLVPPTKERKKSVHPCDALHFVGVVVVPSDML